jgi:protein-S-isoprenylcysteine O-methyltransferase Ste14
MARRDLVPNLLGSAVLFIAPLAFRPERLAHPAPWLAFGTACLILLSQPQLERDQTVRADAADRFSALAIFAAQIAVGLVSVIDFGYGPQGGVVPGWVLGLGLGLVVASSALRLWAIRTLGRFFTSNVRVLEGHRVVRSGPYRLLRHPSYTGALGMALGTACLLGSAWGLLCVLVLSVPAYLHRMHAEEAALAAGLGDEYRDYTRHSRRLVPYVY